MKIHATRSVLDTTAVALSGICLLHCLALPLLLVMLPVSHTGLLDEKTFHTLMLVGILPASVIALGIGCWEHRDRLTLGTGLLGLTILTLTALFGHELVGIDGERLLTSVGGITLAVAHIRNFLECRRTDCDH